jgi:hypothetical protein
MSRTHRWAGVCKGVIPNVISKCYLYEAKGKDPPVCGALWDADVLILAFNRYMCGTGWDLAQRL